MAPLHWAGQAREIALDGEIAVPDERGVTPIDDLHDDVVGHRPARDNSDQAGRARVGAFWKPGDPALISLLGPAWFGAR
jgi:hypothetical protein